jgi:serine/threonine protein phosphatase 1
MVSKSWVIGDVHGCLKTLNSLVRKLRLAPQDEVIFLGDYIDRGPDSAGVIAYLLELKGEFPKARFLKGNHEIMLLDALSGDMPYDKWFEHYGKIMLASYPEINHAEELPNAHLDFLRNLETHIVKPNVVLVHAGLDFDLPNPLEVHDEMWWIREFKYKGANIGNRQLIHGHTPTAMDTVHQRAANLNQLGVLCIDTGCVYTRPGLGFLTAFEWSMGLVVSVPCED